MDVEELEKQLKEGCRFEHAPVPQQDEGLGYREADLGSDNAAVSPQKPDELARKLAALLGVAGRHMAHESDQLSEGAALLRGVELEDLELRQEVAVLLEKLIDVAWRVTLDEVLELR